MTSVGMLGVRWRVPEQETRMPRYARPSGARQISGRLEARSRTCFDREITSAALAAALQRSNQRMNTVGPCPATVFGPDLRLSRSQVTGINEWPLDLCQRILFIRRIKIIDEATAHFGNRCAVGGYAELAMRQALRNRQPPTLAETRKDRE